jgi:hypothetical protein
MSLGRISRLIGSRRFSTVATLGRLTSGRPKHQANEWEDPGVNQAMNRGDRRALSECFCYLLWLDNWKRSGSETGAPSNPAVGERGADGVDDLREFGMGFFELGDGFAQAFSGER